MKNNIGITSEVLPKTLGETQAFNINLNNITVTSGELGLGFILFDTDGTMGVCSQIVTDSDGNPTYTFVISALSAQTIIRALLDQSY